MHYELSDDIILELAKDNNNNLDDELSFIYNLKKSSELQNYNFAIGKYKYKFEINNNEIIIYKYNGIESVCLRHNTIWHKKYKLEKKHTKQEEISYKAKFPKIRGIIVILVIISCLIYLQLFSSNSENQTISVDLVIWCFAASVIYGYYLMFKHFKDEIEFDN